MNARDEDKFWKANEEANRQEEVERTGPTNIEGARPKAISGRFAQSVSIRKEIGEFGKPGIHRGKSNLSRQQDSDERFPRNDEMGGGRYHHG